MKKANIIKKTFALALTGTIIFGASAVSASAVSTPADTPLNQTGTITYNKAFYDKNAEACDAIANGLANHASSINIFNYKIQTDNIGSAYAVALKKNPLFFYVDNNNYYMTTKKSSDGITYINSVIPIYRYDESTTEQMTDKFNAECKKYLAKLSNNMTDYQKALTLHDEIALECEYGLGDEFSTRSCDAYDALVNKESTCEGYTAAYSYLLSLVGIDSDIVNSSAMVHAWNKVCIDGSYYNVDITWDDPVPDNNGLVSHTYFLLSDDEIAIATNNRQPHYDYVSSYSADNSKYDKSLFHEFNTKMCIDDDGSYYAISNSYNSKYKKSLVKYNLEADSAEVVKTIGDYWKASETGYWLNGFAGLDMKDGVLYYNTPSSVYYLNTKTGETDSLGKISSDKESYGMRVIDGKIYVALSSTPNEKTTLTYFGECKDFDDFMLGDVTGDGQIDITDATSIQKYLVEMEVYTEKQIKCADFDKDGYITVNDITAIQTYMADGNV